MHIVHTTAKPFVEARADIIGGGLDNDFLQILSTFKFLDSDNRDDAFQLLRNAPELIPDVEWQDIKRDTDGYYETTNSKTGYSRTGTGIYTDNKIVFNYVKSKTDGIEYDLLYKKNWQRDNNIAADGITGSVWGYKKITLDKKTRIFVIASEFGYKQTVQELNLNPNLKPTCPCPYKIKLFYSDEF